MIGMRFLCGAVSVVILSALGAHPAFLDLQELAQQVDRAGQEGRKQTPVDSGYRYRVNVNLVSLSFRVEKGGEVVPPSQADLKAEDVEVWDCPASAQKPGDSGCRESPFESFGSEELPATLVFVLDESGSMVGLREAVVGGLQAFYTGDHGDPADEISILSCRQHGRMEVEPDGSGGVRVKRCEDPLRGFAYAPGELSQVLEDYLPLLHKGTTISEGAWLGLLRAQEGSHERKAVLLISDGADSIEMQETQSENEAEKRWMSGINMRTIVYGSAEGSTEKYPPVSEYGIPFYAVRPVPVADRGSSKIQTGEKSMQLLAGATGGRVWTVKPEELEEALKEVSDIIRGQYYVAFPPMEGLQAGTVRRVFVKVKKWRHQAVHPPKTYQIKKPNP
ncbi:MAG: hypothetical protein HY402_04650 [Elusimicrobia bacterium]|nr:hypothetical protein [Elusimicrobiota bacterium]